MHAILPLKFFWYTALFVVLSADRITLAYPNHTTKKYGHITLSNAAKPIDHLRLKYELRGFIVLPNDPAVETDIISRYFGDAGCSSLPLTDEARNVMEDELFMDSGRPLMLWNELVEDHVSFTVSHT